MSFEMKNFEFFEHGQSSNTAPKSIRSHWKGEFNELGKARFGERCQEEVGESDLVVGRYVSLNLDSFQAGCAERKFVKLNF